MVLVFTGNGRRRVGTFSQELSTTPNRCYILKSTTGTNARRIAVQMGGVLQYKWEVCRGICLSSRLRSQEGRAIQMGGALRYK